MDSFSPNSVGVIGSGAWGTALAVAARRAGRDVLLWGRDHNALMAIATSGRNPDYLPGLKLDPAPRVSRELPEVMANDIVLVTVPAQELRGVLTTMSVSAHAGQTIVICAKGIERATGKLMNEVARDVLPNATIALLSGPTFATEVVKGLPTAVTIACAEEACGQRLIAALSSKTFRGYYSRDVKGVALGGAMKNVLAIACGIVMGKKLGENARAALMARGLAEMLRLGAVEGADAATMTGLSGLGDLALTCTSPQSRNFTFGYALGEGKSLASLKSPTSKLAEGSYTAEALMHRAEKHHLELPICTGVLSILNGASIDDTVVGLLSRPLRGER